MGNSSHTGIPTNAKKCLPNAKINRCEPSLVPVILLVYCRGSRHCSKSDKTMNMCATQQQVNPNTQEFLTLYQENLARVYHFVYIKVKNREVAEDLTSQIFLKAVRHLDSRRSSQSIRSWLLQVASTTVIDYWRAFYRTPTSSLDVLLEAGWEGPTEDVFLGANDSAAEQLQRILQQLPERDREVLTCRFLLKLSVNETAQRMGVSEANVKILQFRALHRAADLEPATTNLE
jgi:RNA polymerase sigma-70 factor, ECF subfamily